MATLIYGGTSYRVPSNIAPAVGRLIQSIISKGEAEWLPVSATGGEPLHPKPAIAKLLIGPGIPIELIDDDDIRPGDAQQQLADLIERCMAPVA